MNQFTRTELLLGTDKMNKLRESKVLIFGVGGVGGYAVEALSRCGIGTIDLVDADVVDITNINRQIIATFDTIGKPKVEVFKERIRSISPESQVNAIQGFYLPEGPTDNDSTKKILSAKDFDFTSYSYVIDAIDTVAAKLDIIEKCTEAGTPIISAMGCGNRLDPTKLIVTDIHKTEMDPLAKVIRKELRQRGIKKLKVVASTEQPLKPKKDIHNSEVPAPNPGKRSVPGSTSFVPSAAGLIIASEVIRDLTTKN